MSDKDANEQNRSTKLVPYDKETIHDERQRDLGFSEELRDLISIERERIESQNKRTEVVRLAVEMNDASDKRQYDFQMAQLNVQSEGSRRKYYFSTWVAAVSLVCGISLLSLLLGMLFWGSPSQAGNALLFLKVIGVGVGGYGAIGAAVRALRQLLGSMGRPS